jgi:hypothetical protein
MNQTPGLNPPPLISEYEVKDAIIKDGVYLMRDMSKIRNAIQLVNNHLFKKYKQNVTLSVVEETTEYNSFNFVYGRTNMNNMYSVKYNINIIVLNKIDESRMELIKHIKDVFRWIGVHLEKSDFAMTASTSPNIFLQSLNNEKNINSPVVIETDFFITSSVFMKKVEFERDNYQFDYVRTKTKKTMLDKFIGLFV